MMRQGYLPLGHRLDVAVLLVARPWWTRLNLFALQPDAPRLQPLTEAVLVTGYLGAPTWLRRTLLGAK